MKLYGHEIKCDKRDNREANSRIIPPFNQDNSIDLSTVKPDLGQPTKKTGNHSNMTHFNPNFRILNDRTVTWVEVKEWFRGYSRI